MSLDLEARLREFLASAPQVYHIVPTLEISHPAMAGIFCLWRERQHGYITTETGLVLQAQPLNFEVKLAGSQQNLDQNYEIRIDTTDVDDVFREQCDLIPLGTQDRIRVVYREYLSDDLTDVLAVAVLQAVSISFAIGAATIMAVSPRLNMTRTGELYTAREVPMLRGFL